MSNIGYDISYRNVRCGIVNVDRVIINGLSVKLITTHN